MITGKPYNRTRRAISHDDLQAHRKDRAVSGALMWLEAVDLVWTTVRNLNGERAAEEKLGDMLDSAMTRYYSLIR